MTQAYNLSQFANTLNTSGKARAIPELKTCLETKIWDLKYAALMALEKLGDTSGYEQVAHDDDWLIREKAKSQKQYRVMSAEL